MSELYLNAEQQPPKKVLLLGLDLGKFDPDRSMEELSALAEANNMEPVAQLVQKRAAPEAGTVLGEGKLAEAALYCHNLEAAAAIFDGELTGSQLRNLTEALGVEVMDRTMLILEIFRSRAVTNEGKLQTELALLRYRLPRLQGLGEALSRQGGGGAGDRLLGGDLHAFARFNWRNGGGYRQCPAMDPLQFSLRRQLAQIAANGVLGDVKPLA